MLIINIQLSMALILVLLSKLHEQLETFMKNNNMNNSYLIEERVSSVSSCMFSDIKFQLIVLIWPN